MNTAEGYKHENCLKLLLILTGRKRNFSGNEGNPVREHKCQYSFRNKIDVRFLILSTKLALIIKKQIHL